MGFIEDLVTALLLLFVVLDPVGVSPYFASITGRAPPGERGRMVRLAVAYAGVILLAFTLLGEVLLGLLGVSTEEFKVAAGLMLLIYAAADLFEVRIGYTPEARESAAIFPLATPLLAGPGSVATILYIKHAYGLTVALASLAVNIALAYIVLRASTRLVEVLGRHGTLLIGKFMSLVMAGFAVSITLEGAYNALKELSS
ncbi:MAG: MarC family protein [Desulfurococcales archaeon]|nr:MarC family protein [Desulfurococcales archaeon]